MTRAPLACLVAVFLASAALVGPALAQDPSSIYIQVDYMKVLPGMETEYMAVEREIWKPVHEERQRRGDLLDWGLYNTMYASPDAAYDFVTVNMYRGPTQVDGSGWEAAMQAAHPQAEINALVERTRAAREVVRTELWALLSSVQAEGEEMPTGKYLAFNYMAVPSGAGPEYVATERGVWVPVHQARTRMGMMSGWGLYNLVLPRGASMTYNYATIDFFEDMGDVLGQITWNMMSEAHGGAPRTEVDEMTERTEEARTIHTTELWSRVDSLDGMETEVSALE